MAVSSKICAVAALVSAAAVATPEKIDLGVDQYVTDGLVLHLDGIANAGADAAHDAAAASWANLAATGGAAVFTNLCGQTIDTESATGSKTETIPLSDGSAWTAKGYYFGGYTWALMDTAVTLARSVTVQTVSDADPGLMRRRVEAQIDELKVGSWWATLVGTTNETNRLLLYYSTTYRAEDWDYDCLRFNAADGGRYGGLSKGWKGRYATAILDEANGKAALFQTATPESWSNQTAKADIGGNRLSVGSGFGGRKESMEGGGTYDKTDPQVWVNHCLVGTVHAVRVYNRVLADAELRQNRVLDDMRFFQIPDTPTGVVCVASSVGLVPSSAYNFDEGFYRGAGGAEFTASATATVDDDEYVLAGYTVEKWDAELQTWAFESSHVGVNSWTCPSGGGWASRRLTWKWNRCNTLNAYDVGDYVQEDLVLHYDGIRNAGADEAHSDSELVWKDLSPSRNDATITVVTGDETGGWWNEKGFFFNAQTNVAHQSITHYAYGQVADPIQGLGSNFTFQVVCDVPKGQPTIVASGSNPFPAIFGTQDGNKCAIYQADSRTGDVKFNATAFVSSSSHATVSYSSWDNRYLTAALRCGSGSFAWMLTGGVTTNTTWKSSSPASGTTGITGKLNHWGFGSQPYQSGQDASGTTSAQQQTNLKRRALHGEIKAIRVYKHVLSDDELAWNRAVDEIRFFGSTTPPVTNAVVASAIDGLSGAESGAYSVSGQYTFSATNVVMDGLLFSPTGYALQEWDSDDGDWGEATLHSGALCTVEEGAKVRITWQWRSAYVEDGLVLHYDGILNAGVGRPHSPSATIWKDLSATGNDATIHVVGEDGGWWEDDGFFFNPEEGAVSGITRYAYGTVDSPQDFGREFTMQIVCDVPTDIASSGTPYPNIFGVQDGNLCNIYQFQARGGSVHFAADKVTGLGASSPNKRSNMTGWNGRYLNAAVSEAMGDKQNLVADASWGTWVGGKAGSPSYPGSTYWGFGSQGYASGATVETMASGNVDPSKLKSRSIYGKIKAIRVYSRVLSDEELAANMAVDEMRFFGGAASGARTVVVASAVPELSGNEPNGEYEVGGGSSYVFSAPTEPVTANGMDYVVAGFSVEEWDEDAGGYGAAVVNVGACWSPSSSGKYRLTWLWRMTRGFDTTGGALADYAAAGNLVLHLDGIANAGAGVAHDATAVSWANIATAGDAVGGRVAFTNLCGQTVESGSHVAETVPDDDGSGWSADGFSFGGYTWGVMDRDLTLARSVTVQAVTDANPAYLRRRVESQIADAKLGSWWATLVGTTNETNRLLLYYSATYRTEDWDYDALRLNAADGGRYGGLLGGWEGRYATAILDEANGRAALFQTAVPEAWSNQTASADIGENRITVGSGFGGTSGKSEAQVWINHCLAGDVKSVRIYDTALTDAQLEQNRAVDDIRFHRAAPGETNVMVVARHGKAVSNGTGVYNVVGSWTFSAWDATTEDGSLRELLGCTVQKWSESEGGWGRPVFVEREAGSGGMSYPYAEGESPASVRIVWRWASGGTVIQFR